MVFQAAEVCCQHMFARLYINRVINRSITRSLADSCHFKAIGLRAAAHITSFLKTDPHKGMFISLCVCVWPNSPYCCDLRNTPQKRSNKSNQYNENKPWNSQKKKFSKYMKILF